MTSPYSLLARLPIYLLCALLLGCASTQVYELGQEPEYVVVQNFAPFYSVGPMQPRPDASLPLDTRVKLVRKEMGFSKIQLEDGRVGYVANESIIPAPPRPTPTPEPEITSSSTPRRGADRGARYRGPQVNDIPLPDLDIAPEEVPPPVETKPRFRY